MTVGERLDYFRGQGPGFNLLRLILASGVVLWHCFPLTTGTTDLIERTPFWFLLSSMVPMFFALSGFLVIASANRLAVHSFLMNRIARIFPALIIVILCTVFLIGPAVTYLPLKEYFTSPRILRYLLGLVGIISFDLPGVFANNPATGNVNGSLWTVPHELACYLLVGLLIIFRLAHKWWALSAILLLFVMCALNVELMAPGSMPTTFERFVRSVQFYQGAKVVPFFLFGALCYLLRYKLPMNRYLAFACALLILLYGIFIEPSARKSALFWLLSGFPLTYITVWLGMTHLPEPKILHGKDLSYGVYLWHFLVLQVVVLLTGIRSWWILGIIGIIPVGMIALVSWIYVERPVLTWRKRAVLRVR